MTKKTLIIGIGSGRCGTLSLTYLLNRQPHCSVSHEMRPLPGWSREPLENIVDKFQSIIKNSESEFCGDVAFFHLHYLETVFYNFENVKIILLKRGRNATVNSFIKKMEEWPGVKPVDHFRAFRRDLLATTPFDKCFPQYFHEESADRIGTYWDDYYRKAEDLKERYFGSIYEIKTETFFRSPDQINKMLDWIGIQKENRYTDTIHSINRREKH